MASLQALVISWLGTIAPDYPASGQKPKNTPNKYILVSRTGGPREAMVLDRAEILIKVYDKNSNLDASNQADAIGDLIPQLVAYDENITHASVNSIVDIGDNITQYNEYQVYCDVFHRR